jgi:zinc protease
MRPILLTLALAAITGPLAAQDFPTKPPAPMPVKAAQFPPFQEAVLPNGMRLLVVENRKLPVISVQLAFAAGGTSDPDGKVGMADMVATLLTKGAGKRTADEFSAAIEGIGGSIAAGADPDFMTISANFLTGDAALGMGLMADASMRPSFSAKEVELARTQMLSALQLEQSQPSAIASRLFAKGLYGAHPYGRRPDPASVKAITQADLKAFQSTRIRPSGALLVFAGDITLAKAKALATTAFAGWTGAAPATLAAALPPARTATEILLVHRAGSVQSNILAGNLTWGPGDPRVYGARLANQVLGGGGDSRLFLILREQKGWTYGAYSGFTRYKGTGYFQASAEVRTDVTDSALVELLSQVKRIGAETIGTKEFEDAKSSLVGRFPLQVETAAQVATQVTMARLLGLPADYVQTYRQKLAAVTPTVARAAAKDGIKRDAALIVVVGDGAKLYEKLKAIAPVKIVSVDGEPMTPGDFAVKALDVNAGALVARSDSFAVLLQGKAIGSQVDKLEKVAGGWKWTETTEIAMFALRQTTTLTFSDAMEMQDVHQVGSQGGQTAKIDVSYAGGRAKGSATTPSQTGPKTITVDAEMPKGAVDDNAIQPLMAAMKWTGGAKFPVAAFSGGKGTLTQLTLTVAGEEKVTVAAGEFDTWKVEMSGGEAPITMWLTKSNGRVVKIVPTGAPISIELLK